jgi:hypothetical protein
MMLSTTVGPGGEACQEPEEQQEHQEPLIQCFDVPLGSDEGSRGLAVLLGSCQASL